MLQEFKGKKPVVHERAFVHESSRVIGDVEIGEDASVWCFSVLRGDMAPIRIGKRSSVQDATVMHGSLDAPVVVGDDVTIGHSAVIHACSIGRGTLVGMGAIILSDAKIGTECIIGAGAVVTEKKIIPDRSIVMGVPGKIVRQATDDDIKRVAWNARHYVQLKSEYLKQLEHSHKK